MSALDDLIVLEREGARPAAEIRRRNHEALRRRLGAPSVNDAGQASHHPRKKLGSGHTLTLIAGVAAVVGFVGLGTSSEPPGARELAEVRVVQTGQRPKAELNDPSEVPERVLERPSREAVSLSDNRPSAAHRAGAKTHRRKKAPRALEARISSGAPASSRKTERAAVPSRGPQQVRPTPKLPVPEPASRQATNPDFELERPQTTPGFSEELKLLQPAERALNDGRERVARRFLLRHRRRFPMGVFSGEREALLTIVACRLAGTRQRRVVLGRRFARKHPNSAASARVRSECGR